MLAWSYLSYLSYLLCLTILSNNLAKLQNKDYEKCWCPEVFAKLKSICFSILGSFSRVKIFVITEFVVFL